MPDPALLDNPVWHALDSLQKALGISGDDAALYDYLISIFAAVETPGNLETLTRLASQGRILGLLTRPDEVAASLDGWDEMAQIPVHQMIYPNPTSDEAGHYGRRLNDDDAEAMFIVKELHHKLAYIMQNADSLGYLSAEGMLGCTASPRNHYCNACFTGNYPASIENVGKKTHIKEPKNRKAVTI